MSRSFSPSQFPRTIAGFTLPLLAIMVALGLLPIATALAQVPAPPRIRPDSKVNKLLNELDVAYKLHPFKDEWAGVLKQIVEMGPDAVPDLIVELDTTDSDIMQRNLGFMLRAIGDKRAVPALHPRLSAHLPPAGK